MMLYLYILDEYVFFLYILLILHFMSHVVDVVSKPDSGIGCFLRIYLNYLFPFSVIAVIQIKVPMNKEALRLLFDAYNCYNCLIFIFSRQVKLKITCLFPLPSLPLSNFKYKER